MYGYIPEEIAIVHGGKQSVYRGWIDLERDKEEEVVIPAFPADPNNKKKMETAVEWAKWKGAGWDRDRKPNSVKVVRRKNEPFEMLRVLTLEARREGGRAWKVIDGDGFYFDLREDILLDIMRHCGMMKNAEIRGKFIWAVVGSQTKIVRVGSGLYKELVESTKMHNTKTLANGALVPGDICQSKSGDVGVFLGWVSGKDVKISPKWSDPKSPGYSYDRNMIGYGFLESNYKKRGLWWIGSGKSIGEEFLQALKQTKPKKERYPSHYSRWDSSFAVKKSHVFRQKVGKIDLPKDLFEQIRKLGAMITAKEIEDSGIRFDSGRYHRGKTREYSVAETIFPESNYGGRNESLLAWLRPTGEDEPTVTQYATILGDFDLSMIRN